MNTCPTLAAGKFFRKIFGLPFFFTAIFFTAFSNGKLFSQADFGTGLLEDDAAFNQNVEMCAEFSNDGRRASDLPRQFSLRPYSPIPQNQEGINSCIGWAMGYAALTTQKAYRAGETNRQTITNQSFSAMFIYNQVKAGNCLSGAYVHTAAKFLKENGDCGHREFDNPSSDCLREPAESLKKTSKENSIKDYVALFNRDSEAKTKVMRTKRSIAEGKPVVIGIRIKESLKTLKKADPIWRPTDRASDNILGGHAVAVVGYIDSLALFEIMNSWGQKFADDGFFYISYQDFTKYAFQGLQMILEEEELTPDQIAEIESMKMENDPKQYAGKFAPKNRPTAKPNTNTAATRKIAATTPPKNNSNSISRTNSGSNPVSNSNPTQTIASKTIKKPVKNPGGNPNQNNSIAADAPETTPAAEVPIENSTETPTENTFSTDDDGAALSGQFVVRMLQTDEFGTPLMSDGNYQFEEIAPAKADGWYDLAKKDWQVGDYFQIIAQNLKKDSYVYLFSLDGRNKAEIHWPRNQIFPEHKRGDEAAGLGEGALIPHSGAEIVIPGVDRALVRENLLPDVIVMVNSATRIDDFQDRVKKLRDQTSGDITDRVREVFGDIVLSPEKIEMASDAILVKAPTLDGGQAIAIILKIENE